MRLHKLLTRILLLAAVGVAAAAATLYVIASHVPSDYQPAQLPPQTRESSAKKFAAKAVEQYWEKAQLPQPFAVRFTQDELNAYLASLDEIAAQTPQGRRGSVRQLMESRGLADPAVAFKDGEVVLMIRLKDLDKVLSVGLTFEFLPDGRLRVGHGRLRLGSLPIPDSFVRQQLENFRRSLTPRSGPAATRLASGDVEMVMDLPAMLSRVLAAMDGEPMKTDLPSRINGRVIRIIGIDVGTESLTLRVQPIENIPLVDGVHVF